MKVRIGGPFQVTAPMITDVHKVLETGRLSPGTFVKEFEGRFAQYHAVDHGVMTNSGTSALRVALQAMKELHGWYNGAAVIVPAITFVASVNVVLQCNLTPVLVDVNADDYTVNVDRVLDAITPRTKAIMPVHTFGLPADMGAIRDIADNYNLRIIEDACEALGAMYNGIPVGSLGGIGCFSFYMSHHITAGVGGMAITDDPSYARKMRSLINHGWEREVAPMDIDEFNFDEIRKRYYFTSIGHSFRPTELEAAIALPQLDTLHENVKRRIQNTIHLTNSLVKFDELQLPKFPQDRLHSCMMYPLILKKGDKWALMEHLERNGIETREMLPLTNQPCYEGLFDEDDYPVAKWINAQGFYVGCSQYLTGEHMSYVADTIGEWLNG